MEDAATETATPRDLMVYQPDPSHLASADDLLKQGLALADELDLLIETSEEQHHVAQRPLGSRVEDPSTLFSGDLSLLYEDPTQLQQDVPVVSEASDSVEHQPSVSESKDAWAKVWLERGFSKLKQGNFQGARDNFERALQRNARWSSALNGLGMAHYRLANFTEAIQAFRQAIDINPTEAALYCNLGTAFYLLGDFLNAVAAFQKAARLAPREAQAYYGLGLALMRQRSYDKSIAAFRRAVTLDDHHADSYYGMGYVNYLLGELPAAIAALGKAKQRNPQYAQRYETFLKHCLEQDSLVTTQKA